MTGKEYLQDIKANLGADRHQHRMGENLLRAFGYVRRRSTAIDEINATLEELGLQAHPPVSSEMPLRVPRIIFSLKPTEAAAGPEAIHDPETPAPDGSDSSLQEADDSDSNLPEPAFNVGELTSEKTDVKRVSPNASIQEAYTSMLLDNYSQLVVAAQDEPMQQDIKGIVSFQSMAKALMNGKPETVGDCVDSDVQIVDEDADLKSVVKQLSENDVVLVIGQDKRLQGIVTAWDLAEAFAELVDPYKRIGEIEERLQNLVRQRLGKDKVALFLRDHELSSNDQTQEIEDLTMGELQRVLDFPDHWEALELPYDRSTFIKRLDLVREYRNALMHFRGPLTETEMTRLTNFCDTVRDIQL